MSGELGFVHRFVRAQGEDRRLALLLLHGTGADENDLLPLGAQVAPGAALLSPRGKVREGTANRFFRRLAEGVFDLEDLRARTHELADFVETAVHRYDLQDSRLVAVGYSNGANIAASVLLLRPGILNGAVLLRPMAPPEPESPVDLRGVAAFIGAGRLDPLVPDGEARRLAEMLEAAGAQVTLRWHPGGHDLGEGELLALRHWLAERFAAPPEDEPRSAWSPTLDGPS